MDNLDWSVLGRVSSSRHFGNAPMRGGAGRMLPKLAEPVKEMVQQPVKKQVTRLKREAVKKTAKNAIKNMPLGINPLQALQIILIIFVIAFILGFIQGMKAGALLATTKRRK